MHPTQRVIVSAAAVAVLAGAGVSAATAANAADDPNAASSAGASAGTSTTALADHWTDARMAAATPMPDPAATTTGLAAPSNKLGLRSADGTGAAATPKTMTALSAVSKSGVWSAHGKMPARTVGKLYFDDNHGKPFECTASVITAPNKSTIWTAGHCASDGKGHWYKNFQFVPDFYNGHKPYGTWTWKKVSSPNGYFKKGDRHYDVAAIALNTRGGKRIQDVVGSQGYKFGKGYAWSNTYEFGYPYDAHPKRSGFTGQVLRYCVGKTWKIGVINTFEGIHCDQGHGASGGPWLYDMRTSRGWGYLIGNVSYHPSDSKDEERSPHFGDDAINTYNKIKSA